MHAVIRYFYGIKIAFIVTDKGEVVRTYVSKFTIEDDINAWEHWTEMEESGVFTL